MPELLLTCEHGGNRVPRRYARLFREAYRTLESHEGFDLGALQLARAIARDLHAPLQSSTVSRLLIDLNRSPGHARLFSRFVAELDRKERERILRLYYTPHRKRVEEWIRYRASRGARVVHVAVHSFTPVFHGRTRWADLALLYDPSREAEKSFCVEWGQRIRQSGLSSRRNYPYRGTADGLTTYLRRRLGAQSYCGVELEVNQKHLAPRSDSRAVVTRVIGVSLAATLRGASTLPDPPPPSIRAK